MSTVEYCAAQLTISLSHLRIHCTLAVRLSSCSSLRGSYCVRGGPSSVHVRSPAPDDATTTSMRCRSCTSFVRCHFDVVQVVSVLPSGQALAISDRTQLVVLQRSTTDPLQRSTSISLQSPTFGGHDNAIVVTSTLSPTGSVSTYRDSWIVDVSIG